MSRFAVACALVAALGSNVFAHAVRPPQFAEPVAAVRAPELDRAAVRAALEKARAANLANFRAYQKKGVFPSNTMKPGALNVWRDNDGHYCAAATLIRLSGHQALVDKVAEQNNFIRLADVKQGPLMDWILTSGFTQEEIVAIQKPFMPVTERPQVEPAQPVVADLRKAEDARLRAVYRQVERALEKNEKKSLELAVDRVMAHPDLAWQLVQG